ncbi:uncharacterized protein LOC113238163 isoform X2 [Hyposmocoma kahamanoa]|uniref:uncharacterized protein LOC113238163 isoform X2 n=1 Tax=Hyposmocoma kahamanoa TaxID=1477025 RepID=UPI000E6D9172|nr:uncharacterized protein LOC113238163 isoform X2 [Hyposmocoma kahamanoa]
MPNKNCSSCKKYWIIILFLTVTRFISNGFEIWILESISHIPKPKITDGYTSYVFQLIDMICTYYALPFDIILGFTLSAIVYKPRMCIIDRYMPLELEIIVIKIIKLINNTVGHKWSVIMGHEDVLFNTVDVPWTLTCVLLQIISYQAMLLYTISRKEHKIKIVPVAIRIE